MLRITKSYSAESARQYFDVALRKTDYYVQSPGVWGGKGAGRLGLHGEVDRQEFMSIAQNKTPKTGGRLTQRTNTTRKQGGKDKVANRRAGYDCTFSVPKSVSVYLALHDDETLKAVIEAALRAAMMEMESRMQTRVRKGYVDETRPSPNMVFATFVHTETRPIGGIPDPHYHAHVFVMNATYDEVEGEWKAIEMGDTIGDRMYYEAYFDNVLATAMEANGYAIRRTENFFELASVSRDLVERFSKRTLMIEEYARVNYTKLSARARALMAVTHMAFDDAFSQIVHEDAAANREHKKNVKHKTRDALVAHWKTEMTETERHCFDPTVVKGGESENLLDPPAAKELAIKHLFEQVSLKRELHIAAMALRRGLCRISLGEALAWVKEDRRFLRVGKLFTTREVKECEERMIEIAVEGQGKCDAVGLGKEWIISDPLVKESAEQQNAIHHVLKSKDRVISFHGPAGAGKTELMRETVAAIEQFSGKRVMVLAPTSSAAQVLRDQGFIYADTLQQAQSNPKILDSIKGHFLWVDEAGFMSVKQMLEVLEFVVKNKARVILTGDTRQHHSVEWGDALRILEQHGAVNQAVLTKSYRQRIPELREAIEDISQGRTALGFDKLDKFGVVQEVEENGSRLEQIAAKQVEALRDGKSSLAIAPTHQECREAAAAIRKEMRSQGLLSDIEFSFRRLRRVNLTEAQQRDAVSYELGQLIEFHRICKGGVNGQGRFKSGEQWTVLRREEGRVIVGRHGQEKVLPLDNAKKFSVFEEEKIGVSVGDRVRITKNLRHRGERFLNNEIRIVKAVSHNKITFDKGELWIGDSALHIDQGFVVTSHASQGKTVDQVIVCAPVRSFSQVNQAQFYVSMSRARYAMWLYTDSKVALREAVCQSSTRLSYSELMKAGLNKAKGIQPNSISVKQPDKEREWMKAREWIR